MPARPFVCSTLPVAKNKTRYIQSSHLYQHRESNSQPEIVCRARAAHADHEFAIDREFGHFKFKELHVHIEFLLKCVYESDEKVRFRADAIRCKVCGCGWVGDGRRLREKSLLCI